MLVSSSSDGASFGGVQAMTSFMEKFGSYSEVKNAYTLPEQTASLMNSLPLLGKFLGTVIVGPIIERIGHRYTMAVTCIIQIVGAISKFFLERSVPTRVLTDKTVQVTSNKAPQFVCGRFLVYTAVGLVENVRYYVSDFDTIDRLIGMLGCSHIPVRDRPRCAARFLRRVNSIVSNLWVLDRWYCQPVNVSKDR